MPPETVLIAASLESTPPAPKPTSRLWPALVPAALFWLVNLVARLLEMPYFLRFLFGMAAPALFFLIFSIWWWLRRSVSLFERLVGYILVVGGAFAVAPLTHPSLGTPQMLMVGIPVMITIWALWMLWAERTRIAHRWLGSAVVVLLTYGAFTLFRIEGLDGDLKASIHWRWSPTAEEMFLTHTTAQSVPKVLAADSPKVVLSSGDWPEFRGAQRGGIVSGVSIRTDWNERPPKLLWKQRIGPAWSSLIVVGDRLFTQEQRGEKEAVVCYSATNGRQLWVHEDVARFWEAVSGAGPRATPTFANGKIYALGATGILNCLDASSGVKKWSHNLQTDAAAIPPQWGLSGSPLVVDKTVVVYGGGENQNNLLAYDAETGASVWTAAAGVSSYASPQFLTIADRPQILMLNDTGLVSVEPANGRPLWTAGLAMPGAPRNLQPHLVGERQLLVGTLSGFGLGVCEVAPAKGTWSVTEKWASTQMKAEFSEIVIHDAHAYGFDGAILSCVDLADGQRKWKGGRYGRGQVILLAEQSLLLVLSESGEAVLVAAQPTRHEEFTRFQAIEGKTWNHPIVAHGRLYARNAEEIACYQLTPSSEQ